MQAAVSGKYFLEKGLTKFNSTTFFRDEHASTYVKYSPAEFLTSDNF